MMLSPAARLAAALLAAVAAVSIAAQSTVIPDGPDTIGGTIWVMAGYFTILTNALIVISTGAMAARGRALSPGWLGGLTLWIAIVGVIYHTMLSDLWDPQGLAWWADQGLHSAVPALTFLWWAGFAPKAGLGWRHAALWLIWPLIYAAYALIRAGFTGAYPYPFIDLNVLSLGAFAANVAWLSLGFFLGGLVLVGLARLIRR